MKFRTVQFTALLFVGVGLAASPTSRAQPVPPPGLVKALRPTIVTVPPGGPPIVIDQPGSYILGGGLTGVATKNGIEISASNVTLDLDGHVLDGDGAGLDGIEIQGSQQNIAVFNGTITGWTRYGVRASGADNSQFYLLRVSNFGSSGGWPGIFVSSSIVDRCVVLNDANVNPLAGDGIVGFNNCRISNCVSVGNAGDGIVGGNRSRISNCISSGNSGAGIKSGTAGTVLNCTVRDNDNGGIVASSNSVVRGCTLENNGPFGIRAGDRCLVAQNSVVTTNQTANGVECISGGTRVENNNVYVNGTGFLITGTGNLIIKNSASGPGTHYSIVAGNAQGAIINMTGGGIISADPWANLRH